MKKHKPLRAPIPGLGQRSIKTALATAILALIYLPFGEPPTFACIGAIFGMGNDVGDSKKSGGNRLIGTIIGGFLGLIILWLEHLIFPEGNYYIRVALIFFGVILLVWASILFKWPGAVQPGGVVLCIILFETPADHLSYAVGRIFDTAVGVVFAILINAFFNRDRIDKWLGRDTAGEEPQTEQVEP